MLTKIWARIDPDWEFRIKIHESFEKWVREAFERKLRKFVEAAGLRSRLLTIEELRERPLPEIPDRETFMEILEEGFREGKQPAPEPYEYW